MRVSSLQMVFDVRQDLVYVFVSRTESATQIKIDLICAGWFPYADVQ